MKQVYSRALQKWGVSMTLTFGAMIMLLLAGVVLVAVLPPGYYWAILTGVSVLGVVFAVVIGRVVRWLVED